MCNILSMQVMRTNSNGEFFPIPPEPWGRRLERARTDVARLSLADAASIAGRLMLTSDATISRLEGLDQAPSGPRSGSRRQLAFVLCLAYQVDPAEFGLTIDDLPPGLQAAVLADAPAVVDLRSRCELLGDLDFAA